MDLKKFKRIVLGILFDKQKRFLYIAKAGGYNWMSDEVYLKKRFKYLMGYELDFNNPKTFNEKLQWLKLYDRRSEYIKMVDKYEVKNYVSSVIGSEYIIPTLGVWEKFDDIEFNKLPPQFVLKCTHDSGGLVIVKDKSKLDLVNAKKKITSSLKKDFYYIAREWPYRNVKHQIIAEQYMANNEYTEELIDYKMMCFNGKVKCCFTCTGRKSEEGLKVTFFDLEWKRMPFERHYSAESKDIKKPKSFELMIYLAEKLAQDIPFVRIDFYEIDEKPYFGEITLYPGAGFEEFNPEEWDEILGSWINLDKIEQIKKFS